MTTEAMTSAEDVALEFFTHHPTHIERAADEVEARNAAVVALAALILRERKEAGEAMRGRICKLVAYQKPDDARSIDRGGIIQSIRALPVEPVDEHMITARKRWEAGERP